MVGYFIRVVRLAIAYNKSYRIKFARYVKWTPMMWFLAGTGLALTTRAYFFWGELPEHKMRYGNIPEVLGDRQQPIHQ